jgi:hypothetical protein
VPNGVAVQHRPLHAVAVRLHTLPQQHGCDVNGSLLLLAPRLQMHLAQVQPDLHAVLTALWWGAWLQQRSASGYKLRQA